MKVPESLAVDSGVFPAVGVVANVPETNGRDAAHAEIRFRRRAVRAGHRGRRTGSLRCQAGYERPVLVCLSWDRSHRRPAVRVVAACQHHWDQTRHRNRSTWFRQNHRPEHHWKADCEPDQSPSNPRFDVLCILAVPVPATLPDTATRCAPETEQAPHNISVTGGSGHCRDSFRLDCQC